MADDAGAWRRHGSIPNREAGLPASIAMWDHYMDLNSQTSKLMIW